MSMFFTKCSQCGSMIPKDSTCPNCRYTPPREDGSSPAADFLDEFARRHGRHTMNYSIFMGLILATGVVGVITGILWVRVMYFGSVVAFVLIGVMTVLTVVLSGVLA